MQDYLTLQQATLLCPSRPHSTAIWRWCRHGLKSRSGRVIRLGHIRAGRRVYTTEEKLSAFFNELTAADAEHFEDGSKRRNGGEP